MHTSFYIAYKTVTPRTFNVTFQTIFKGMRVWGKGTFPSKAYRIFQSNLKSNFCMLILTRVYSLDAKESQTNDLFREKGLCFQFSSFPVLVHILGSKSNSKPLSTYSKCLTMAVARTQRHYCNKCHLKRPKCICKKQ